MAGLEQVQQGHILLEGRDITDLDARQRQIGMVFQQYSLFPNMTVEQNMAFGLKIQRLSKAEINDRITEALAMVGLQDKADAYPAQLSGGQQQRGTGPRHRHRPKVLLLDEPLSAIDAKLRKSLQVEIRRIQKQLNITTIFVTHDPGRSHGHVRPHLPAELRQDRADGYPHCHLYPPRTKFAAGFIGNSYNVLEPLEFGRVTGDIDLPAQPIAIRPEVLNIAREKIYPAPTILRGTVIDSTPRGNVLRYKVDVNGVQLSADTLFRSFSIYENGSKGLALAGKAQLPACVEEEAV